jgi:hypothetical protein
MSAARTDPAGSGDSGVRTLRPSVVDMLTIFFLAGLASAQSDTGAPKIVYDPMSRVQKLVLRGGVLHGRCSDRKMLERLVRDLAVNAQRGDSCVYSNLDRMDYKNAGLWLKSKNDSVLVLRSWDWGGSIQLRRSDVEQPDLTGLVVPRDDGDCYDSTGATVVCDTSKLARQTYGGLDIGSKDHSGLRVFLILGALNAISMVGVAYLMAQTGNGFAP